MRRFVSSLRVFHHESMRIRRASFLILVATVVLTSCGSNARNEATPPTTSPATTTTTIDIRSRQVPEHPDVAYVEAVLKELFRIRGDIRRDVFATQSYSTITEQRIEDIYDERQAVGARRIWTNASTKTHPEALPVPGNEVARNIEILDSQLGCVVFAADNDNSAVLQTPNPTNPRLIMEIRSFPTDNRTNPTAWKWTYEAEFNANKKANYTCAE
jgi:hypothetical protein